MSRYDSDMIVPDGWGFVTTVDRREFLKLTSTGLLVLCFVDRLFGQEEGRQGGSSAPTDLNAYLHVGADGHVTCFVGKIEMGQGTMSSLPMLVAEELDVPLSMVNVVMGDTDLCPWDRGTFGSASTRQFGPILRAAAAEAKASLLVLAAERLQAPVSDLKVESGVVMLASDPSKKVSYGQLAEGKRIERRVEKPALEAASVFTVIGKTQPRRDAVDKVTGKAKYAGDIIPAGALHARILRPPAHGAKLLDADTSAAEKVPGVRVIKDGDLIAVLHQHRDEATKALALVKANWSPSPSTLDDRNIFDHLVQNAPQLETVAEGGSIADGERDSTQIFEETYRQGYVAHAAMETHSAVAAIENGKVTVWASTQTPFPLQTQVARALNMPLDKVRVIAPFLGGGFGGKSASQQAIEAARLTAAAGRPVRVVWSREEEFFFDTFQPAAVAKVRAGLNDAKTVALWEYQVIGAGSGGAAQFYNFANHRTAAQAGWNRAEPNFHPFAVGPWRSPGVNSNSFARESHINLLASKAGVDPVEFRLKHLSDARMTRVLNAAAEKFGWAPKPAPSGRGFGVACGIAVGTYVATCAEVQVDKNTGKVQVVRVVAAQDMGIIVNPEGARQQMEGCMTMGLGYALGEELHFAKGAMIDTNFNTYKMPRFSWVPKIDTVLLDGSDRAPQGGGEPTIVTMGAVIASAVFDAVGARVTGLPLTAERVKAALGLEPSV